MVVTNLITFLSYVTICLTLLYMVRRTGRVIARDWAYFLVGFALFIVACGTTHLLEVVTTWVPVFWVNAWTNLVTAVLSASVAVMLIRRAKRISFGIDDYASRLAATEDEKLQMKERVFAAQKIDEWSKVSTIVSHEIRSPLEAIQNVLYLIRGSEGVSGEVCDLAEAAGGEVSRVLAISGSALSFFRQTTEPEPTDLHLAARSVVLLVRPLIEARSIAFGIEAKGDCVVEALPGETRQVLLNLIRNACESITHDGAKVTVRITGRADGVEIEVADEGSGIAPEVLPTLFQFGMSTKREKGNGMGLWTVKHIVEKHGGDVRVVSTPGAGTRFTLRWPRPYRGLLEMPGQVAQLWGAAGD